MTRQPKYVLTTIKDIFDQIPADRIEACLSELAVAMRQAKETAALIGATAAALAEQKIDYRQLHVGRRWRRHHRAEIPDPGRRQPAELRGETGR